MNHIKFTNPAYASFTGRFGQIEFKDGVSVEPVSGLEVKRIGAITQIEEVGGSQVGVGVDQIKSKKNEAPVKKETPTKADEPKAEAKVEAPAKAKNDAPLYNEAELSAIADEKGIAGLREIAESFGVKGRGINELIKEIIAAQKG